MADGIDRDEFYRAMDGLKDDVRAGFYQVNTRLDGINGRVRENEQDVAKLYERSAQVQQRSERAATSGKAWGAGIGGAIVAIAEVARSFWK